MPGYKKISKVQDFLKDNINKPTSDSDIIIDVKSME